MRLIFAPLRLTPIDGSKRNDLPSIWHLIHHRYEQRFDPAAYLRSCEKHMESDWRYGESLISAAIFRGDFAQTQFRHCLEIVP